MEKYDFIKLMLKSRNLSVNDKKRLILLATQEIEKKDITSGKEIIGAKMHITDLSVEYNPDANLIDDGIVKLGGMDCLSVKKDKEVEKDISALGRVFYHLRNLIPKYKILPNNNKEY